jgi:hypothetical protein
MTPVSAVLRAVSWLAVLGLPACTSLLYDDRCGIESRNVGTGARIRTTQGDSMGLAIVSLGESRADGSRSVSWYISGNDLRGHLQSARLVASADTSSHLLPLTGGPGEPDIIITENLMPYAGPVAFDRLFDLARTGGLTVVLETDISGRPIITLPMQVEVFNDWGKPHCS